MDFDFGTLIYFILTILFVILGAVGKKKPRQGESLQDVQMDEAREMENESEVFGKNYRKYVHDEDFEPEAPRKQEMGEDRINTEMANLLEAQREDQLIEAALDSSEDRIDNLQDEVESKPEPDETPGIDDYNGIRDVIKETEMGSGKEQEVLQHDIDDILADFEAKNAVVYSEIIKPKYF